MKLYDEWLACADTRTLTEYVADRRTYARQERQQRNAARTFYSGALQGMQNMQLQHALLQQQASIVAWGRAGAKFRGVLGGLGGIFG